MQLTFCGKTARNSYEKTDKVWPNVDYPPNLMRCPDCGLRLFDGNQVSALWEHGSTMRGRHNIDHEYSDHHVPAVKDFVKLVRHLLGITVGPFRHHDIGCAYGHLVYHMRSCGIDSTGSEIDQEAIGTGRLRPEWAPPGADHALFAGLFTDFVKTKQNLITMVHVLEHVSNPVQLLKDAHDLLEDRGLLYIAVPNALHLPTGRFGLVNSDRVGIDAEHISFFTPRSLSCACEAAGLEIVEIYTDLHSFHHRMEADWMHSMTGRFSGLLRPELFLNALNENFLSYQLRMFARRRDSVSILPNLEIIDRINAIAKFELMAWHKIMGAVEDAPLNRVLLGGGNHSIIEFVNQSDALVDFPTKDLSLFIIDGFNGLSLGDVIAGRVVRSIYDFEGACSIVLVSETEVDFERNAGSLNSIRASLPEATLEHLKLYSTQVGK